MKGLVHEICSMKILGHGQREERREERKIILFEEYSNTWQTKSSFTPTRIANPNCFPLVLWRHSSRLFEIKGETICI